jgi:paraquat-inducible protein A
MSWNSWLDRIFLPLLTLAYLSFVIIPARETIRHSQAEIDCLRQAYDTNNLQNQGSLTIAKLDASIVSSHHFFGPMIVAKINGSFHFPPWRDAQKSLQKIPGFLRQAGEESGTASSWSGLLLAASLAYLFLAVFVGAKDRLSRFLFVSNVVSVVFFVVGVLAPALVVAIFAPKTSASPSFVLHSEIRSVMGVILELYASGHWIVAACLTIFSLLTPLIKSILLFIALPTKALGTRAKISKFLNLVSKWSMTDVFVAAIILTEFAVKTDPDTQAYVVRGFYYFLGYCLLSLTATTALQMRFHKIQEARRR